MKRRTIVITCLVIAAAWVVFMMMRPDNRSGLPLAVAKEDVGQPKDITLAIRIREAGIRRDAEAVGRMAKGLNSHLTMIRQVAATALGRLGTDQAIKILSAAAGKSGPNDPALPFIKVALARARSAGAKGRGRISAFEQELGITHAELVRHSKNLERPRARPSDIGPTTEDLAVHTVAQLLAEEKARGRDISSISKEFSFDKADKVRLDLAGRTRDVRLHRMIQYLSQLKSCTGYDYRIAQMLADEGNSALPLINAELRRASSKPSAFLAGHSLLTGVLGNIGDPAAIPVLTDLASDKRSWVSRDVKACLKALKEGRRIPLSFD